MIQNRLLSSIKLRYAIGNIEEISKLDGGYWNRTFKLATDRGDYVLRISPPRTLAESVVFQHDLMRFMHSRIGEIPLPIARRDGDTFFVFENQIVSLLPFMPGEMASRKNPANRKSAAQMLARLHRVALEYPENFLRSSHPTLANFDWEENSNWRLTNIQNLLTGGAKRLKKQLITPIGEKTEDCLVEIVARRGQLEQELKIIRGWIKQLKSSKRKLIFAPTHGDYYPSNLLIESNQISAVLDWDECRSEWLAYELGRAVWEFCRDESDGGLISEAANSFVKTYQEASGSVQEDEYDLLAPFIRCIRVQEILFSLGEAVRGEWWEPEYTLYNFVALNNLRGENLFV